MSKLEKYELYHPPVGDIRNGQIGQVTLWRTKEGEIFADFVADKEDSLNVSDEADGLIVNLLVQSLD